MKKPECLAGRGASSAGWFLQTYSLYLLMEWLVVWSETEDLHSCLQHYSLVKYEIVIQTNTYYVVKI